MNDSDYRLFALDVISEVEDLLHCQGSRRALSIAGRLAARQSVDREVVEAARIEAMNDCFRSSMELHDGRDQAALAAWFVLSPAVKDAIHLILGAVAKAKATRELCSKRRTSAIPDTDQELECFAATELDLLETRLEDCQQELGSGEHNCIVLV